MELHLDDDTPTRIYSRHHTNRIPLHTFVQNGQFALMSRLAVEVYVQGAKMNL